MTRKEIKTFYDLCRAITKNYKYSEGIYNDFKTSTKNKTGSFRNTLENFSNYFVHEKSLENALLISYNTSLVDCHNKPKN